jgi:hypothetical protein
MKRDRPPFCRYQTSNIRAVSIQWPRWGRDGLSLRKNAPPTAPTPLPGLLERWLLARCEDAGFRPVAEMELRQNAADHRLDDGLGKVELIRDGAVVQSLAQEEQRLELHVGQARQKRQPDLVDAKTGKELFGHQAMPFQPQIDQLINPVDVDVLEYPGIREGQDMRGVEQFAAAQHHHDPAAPGQPEIDHRLVFA